MKAGQHGLTLVEMLVGMTLLFITLTLLFSASYQISRQNAAGENLAQLNDDYRLVMRFVSNLIEQTAPIAVVAGKHNHNQAMFEGRADQVSLVSYLPSHAGGAGLYLTSLALEEGVLTLSYQPLISLTNGDAKRVETEPLLAGISGLGFDYFSPQTGWQSEWINRAGLPQKVRIRIDRPGDDNWPLLTVAIASETVPMRPHLAVAAGEL